MSGDAHPLMQTLKRNHSSMQALSTQLQALQLHDPVGLARTAVEVFHRQLLPHFRMEEEIVCAFVAGRNEDLDQIIYILKDDHAEIEVLFRKLESEVNQLSLLRAIGSLLEEHVRTEEADFFDLLEASLTPEKSTHLQQQIERASKP